MSDFECITTNVQNVLMRTYWHFIKYHHKRMIQFKEAHDFINERTERSLMEHFKELMDNIAD